MGKAFVYILITTAFLSSCIGEDILLDAVPPSLRINSCLDSLEKGTTEQLEATYFNFIGEIQAVNINWTSSDNNVATINENAEITAVEYGETIITASYNSEEGLVIDQIKVHVGNSTTCEQKLKNGTIMTTSSYQLEGDFVMYEDNGNLIITIADNYKASTALPGLYVYLANNNTTTVGAYEIGEVTVFTGAHMYVVPGVSADDYKYLLYFCKPFNVKVGDGEIKD